MGFLKFHGRRRDRIILASGPVLGAAVGSITNLITSAWNWWLFVALVLAISLAAAGAAVTAGLQTDGPLASARRRGPAEPISTLPARAGIFVGRDRELDRFLERLKPGPERGGRSTIFIIIGGPGSGKTALAIQAAHQLSNRYADAQLYLAFRSYSGEASSLNARDALVDLLAATSPGTPLGALDTDQLSARWRSETNGRRMLLLLDDVESLAQIAPLLPNSSDCAVIITSRLMIPGVDADAHIELGGLAADDVALMIREITLRASQVVEETLIWSLAQVYTLPLSVRHLADQLVAGSVDRLRVMMSDRDLPIDAAAMFRTTIGSLTGTEQLVLRRTALYPGPHASTAAVGALADISSDEAEAALASLHVRGIIGKPDPYGYQLHDLVRAVALEQSDANDTDDDRNRARYRLFGLTTDVLAELNTLINSLPPTDTAVNNPKVGHIASDEISALSWFERYFEDLRAITRLAIRYEWPDTWRLTSGLVYFMRIRRNIPQAIEMIGSSLQIALARGDDLGRAVSLLEIGILHRAISSYGKAQECVKAALPLFKARGDVLGEAGCHLELGHINHHLSRFQDALDSATLALPLLEQAGNMRGIADASGALGMLNRLLGNYQSARPYLDYALSTFTDIGSQRNQAWILIELGTIDRQTGSYGQARWRFAKARELYHDADDRNGCAWADRELGIVFRISGEYSEAELLLGHSLAVFTEIGSKRNIADASIELATLHRVTGNLDKARTEAVLALEIYREIRNVRGAAWAELELSVIERHGGSPSSIRRLERLLSSYEQIGDRSGLARVYLELGSAEIARSDTIAARQHLRTALFMYQDIGSPEAGAADVELSALSP